VGGERGPAPRSHRRQREALTRYLGTTNTFLSGGPTGPCRLEQESSMRRSVIASTLVLVLVSGLAGATSAAAAPEQAGAPLLEVYAGEVELGQVEEVVA